MIEIEKARPGKPELLTEIARNLALAMAYEDTVRVAELNIRASRFAELAGLRKAALSDDTGVEFSRRTAMLL